MSKHIENSIEDGKVEKKMTPEVFVHDLSTPLMTAKLNAELITEHGNLLANAMTQPEAQNLPENIRVALQEAPQIIQKQLTEIQTLVQRYKQELDNQSDLLSNTSDESIQGELTTANTPLRILIVDDEAIHHDIAKAVLGTTQDLEHAYSGEEAIKICEHTSFDVVLMDMQMPALSGKQTVLRIREIASQPTTVIGLSNMPIQSQKQELLSSGFSGFLDKPLRLEDFDTLIKALRKMHQ